MIKVFFRVFFVVTVSLLIFNVFIEPPLETKILYYPVKGMTGNPGTVNLVYEDINLRTSDGQIINGWFVPNKASKKVILYFHGNGGNISYRLDRIAFLHRLPVNIFIIDYRGFGRSQGTPSENGLYLDAKAAYDFLINQKKYQPDQIIIFGRSLGGAVAADLAGKEMASALILVSTFTSVKDLAVRTSPLWRWPIVWIRSEFNAFAKIDKIGIPIYFIHSRQDEVIPYQMSVALYNNARQPKKLLLEDSGGHNDFIVTREYIKMLQEAIR